MCTVPGCCPRASPSSTPAGNTAWRHQERRGVSWDYRDERSKFCRRTAESGEFRQKKATIRSEVRRTCQKTGGVRCAQHGGCRGKDGWKRGWKYRVPLDGVCVCVFLRKRCFALECGIPPLHPSCLHGTQPSPSLDPSVPCSHLKRSVSRLSQGALYSRLASVSL